MEGKESGNATGFITGIEVGNGQGMLDGLRRGNETGFQIGPSLVMMKAIGMPSVIL